MKMTTDYKNEIKIDKKNKRIDRQIRKKEWTTTTRYCSECFYSLKDDEEDNHDNCFVASKERDRKIHPNLMKILKEKKKTKSANGA